MKFTPPIRLGFLVAVIFLNSSCSEDGNGTNASDPGNQEPQNIILGNWLLTEYEVETEYDINEDGISSTSIMDETGCYQNQLLLFNENETGSSEFGSFPRIELIEISGPPVSFEYSFRCIESTRVIPFIWWKNDNIVDIEGNGIDWSGSISGRSMTFVLKDAFVIHVDDGNGNAVFISEDATLTYTKQ